MDGPKIATTQPEDTVQDDIIRQPNDSAKTKLAEPLGTNTNYSLVPVKAGWSGSLLLEITASSPYRKVSRPLTGFRRVLWQVWVFMP